MKTSLRTVVWVLVIGASAICLWEIFRAFHDSWPRLCDGTDGACLREWIDALSGWAAFVVGAGTIFFLARQTRELKRQTEFVLGDAMPTVSITDDDVEESSVQLRVTNWNRHPVRITGIKVEKPVWVRQVLERRNRGTVEWPLQRIEELGISIPGWENRFEPPPFRVLELTFSSREDAQGADHLYREVGVHVHGTILGNRHKAFDLHAVHPYTLVWVENGAQASKHEGEAAMATVA